MTLPVEPEVAAKRLADAMKRTESVLIGTAEEVSVRGADVSAVFRIGPFRDDVLARVERTADGQTNLRLCSRSRLGWMDFSVNRRRVHRLLRTMAEERPG